MLTSLDEAFEASGQRADLTTLATPQIVNGFYTLTFPCGTHKTFRIRTEQNGVFKGKRTLAILTGPVNTSEYDNFAMLTNTGFAVWQKHRKGKLAEYAELLWLILSGEVLDGHTLQISKRCLACNRPLTTPESLELGYGPNCAARLGKA